MLSSELFYKICSEKWDIALQNAHGREIWIYGAGVGGSIIKQVADEHHCIISGFIDKNADNIKTKDGLDIKSIKDIKSSEAYLLISLRAYDASALMSCEQNEFKNEDIYVFAAGNDYNTKDIVYRGCKIGKYTYGYEELLSIFPIAKSIGRYCSIASGAKIYNNHPTKCISTHPFLDHPMFVDWERYLIRKHFIEEYGNYHNNAEFENSSIRNNPPVIVGNDVWIGANSIILPGVVIGDGAIIAAGSVVVKSVGDYEVVAGVPAKVIKKRFTDEQINLLKRIKWWDWDEKQMDDNIELFYCPEAFFEKFST